MARQCGEALRAHTWPQGPSVGSAKEGGGLLRITPHCVVVTVQGAELASCASHTERRQVPTGANRRRGTIRDRQRGTSCPKGEMSEANESTCGVTESRNVPCGRGGSGRSTSAVGNGAEPRAMRSAGVGSLDVAGRFSDAGRKMP
jgi:hypothetical protein